MLIHGKLHLLAWQHAQKGHLRSAHLLQQVAVDLFPNDSWCGNEMETEASLVSLINSYVKEPEGLQPALEAIAPRIINNPLVRGEAIAERASELLRSHLTPTELEVALTVAIASIERVGDDPASFRLNLVGVEVPFHHFAQESAAEEVRTSSFYRLCTEVVDRRLRSAG
ncbi:MAG: hypothetical protein K8J08_11790 [Thermoanaerobaculia bacterium]|nr:hypothetical protein [Thermoanaerobaculia bacterium]